MAMPCEDIPTNIGKSEGRSSFQGEFDFPHIVSFSTLQSYWLWGQCVKEKVACEMIDQNPKISRVTREESESHWSFKNEAFMLDT